MKVVFYPGCTLKTAAGYKESILAVNSFLGIGWSEVEDWNCCGATAYFSLDELVSLVLPARVMAKAEKQEADVIVTPCNACFATLRKAKEIINNDPETIKKIQTALAEEGLEYNGKIKIRHILDYYVTEMAEKIEQAVVRPLSDLKVACYYGCQYTRPVTKDTEDDPERPSRLDELMKILGADVIDYTAKTYCCGAAQMVTHEEGCLKLVRRIVLAAEGKGANVIVTICPLCHFNLELGISKLGFQIPVVFFTQLIGIALGLDKRSLGLEKLLIPARTILAKI